MKAVIQRVKHASVTIDGNLYSKIGHGLLVLFFVVGVIKTCGSFADLKRPEAALKGCTLFTEKELAQKQDRKSVV